ncbi:hypothetical protein [Paenibacillus sp. FSL R10-2778]|uniref:hypothetical protein n=1 Tax=Paenibacillus sp. FSL R10-2778 TaxID=2954659 RepID=UPI0031593A56
MNKNKINILIGFITFIIVYTAGVLLFQVLSYGGYFFIEKNSYMMTLYTFLVGVACLLFIALWIKTERKIIIIINTSIAIAMLLFTPAIANTYYTASEDIRMLFHSNYKNEIQAIERIIKDHHLPFSIYKKESLQNSKYYNYLSILVIKNSDSKLTSEEIQSFIGKMPITKMSIYFSDNINGRVVIIKTDENRDIKNCTPKKTCSNLQIK